MGPDIENERERRLVLSRAHEIAAAYRADAGDPKAAVRDIRDLYDAETGLPLGLVTPQS